MQLRAGWLLQTETWGGVEVQLTALPHFHHARRPHHWQVLVRALQDAVLQDSIVLGEMLQLHLKEVLLLCHIARDLLSVRAAAGIGPWQQAPRSTLRKARARLPRVATLQAANTTLESLLPTQVAPCAVLLGLHGCACVARAGCLRGRQTPLTHL